MDWMELCKPVTGFWSIFTLPLTISKTYKEFEDYVTKNNIPVYHAINKTLKDFDDKIGKKEDRESILKFLKQYEQELTRILVFYDVNILKSDYLIPDKIIADGDKVEVNLQNDFKKIVEGFKNQYRESVGEVVAEDFVRSLIHNIYESYIKEPFFQDLRRYTGNRELYDKISLITGVINANKTEIMNAIKQGYDNNEVFIRKYFEEEYLPRLKKELGLIPAKPIDFKVRTSATGGMIGVPDLPDNFVPRPDCLEELKSRLMTGGESCLTGIIGYSRTTGIHGMGGIGKSVLAAALAHDEEVHRAFPDGIVWITIGREKNLLSLQSALANALGGEKITFEGKEQGRLYLEEMMAGRHCLVILDDVWDPDLPRLLGKPGSGGRIIITTRKSEVLKVSGASEFDIEELDESLSLELLAKWSGLPVEKLPGEAKEIVEECGRLPLALAAAGAMVQGRPDYWNNVLDKLRNARLDKIKRAFPCEHPDLLRAIQVSVEDLDEDVGNHFLDFAVFPEDEHIPEAVLETFWESEGLDQYEVQDVIKVLIDRSMIKCDNSGRIYLHDLYYDYAGHPLVRENPGIPSIRDLHERLIDAYGKKCSQKWPEGQDDGYFFQYLPYHFFHAGKNTELKSLLLDFPWMYAKLEKTGVNSLIADYDFLPDDNDLQMVRGALRLSSHCLFISPEHLPGQLTGRLLSFESAEIKVLLSDIKNLKIGPWLRPLSPTLPPPGGPLEMTLAGHSDSVNAVAISPDGRRAVSGSSDRTLKVWDLDEGREISTLWGHSGEVLAVAISPDGKRAVSGSWDETLKVWDLEEGREFLTLQGHSGGVWAVAVSPDGRRAVSGSYDDTLKVWDLDKGTEISTLQGHSGVVNAIAITPDGKRAVSGSNDTTLKVWCLEEGREISTLEGHSGWVNAVAISPDGKRAVSGSSDKTLKVWDLDKSIEISTLKGHLWTVNAIAISPDGRRAVSGSSDNTLKVWDMDKGIEISTLKGHLNAVWAVAISPDGRRAVSGSLDGTLKVWDLDKGREILTLQGHSNLVLAVAISPDGKRAVSGSFDHTLKVWDLDGGIEISTLKGHSNWVLAVAVSPDGKRAFSGSEDCTLKVWNLDEGREISKLQEHSDSVMSIAISPDGRRTVSGSLDGSLKVWDLDKGREISTLQGHLGGINAVAISPDGRKAVSGADDYTLKVWDLDKSREISTLQGHSGAVNAIAISPNGERAVSGSDDHTIKVWDLDKGKEISTLHGHSDVVWAIAISSDGKLAVSGSEDHTLKVWNLDKGREISTLQGHSGCVWAIAISSGERRAVSGSLDNTLKVWDLNKGREISTLRGHSNIVWAIAVSPNGKLAVSGSWDSTLKVWDLDKGSEISTLQGHSGWVSAVAISPNGKLAVSGSSDKMLKLWDLDKGKEIACFHGEGTLRSCAFSPDGKTIVTGGTSGIVHFLRLEGI